MMYENAKKKGFPSMSIRLLDTENTKWTIMLLYIIV